MDLGNYVEEKIGQRFVPNIPERLALPPYVVKWLAGLARKMEYDPKGWTSIDLICHHNSIVFKWHSDCHVRAELPLTADLPPFNFCGGMHGHKILKAIKAKSAVIVSALGGVAVLNGDKREYYRGEFKPNLNDLSHAEDRTRGNVVELVGIKADTVARLAHAMGYGKEFNHIGLHGLIWRKHEDGAIDLIATDRKRLAVHNQSYSPVAEQYLLPRELIEQALALADGGYLFPRLVVNDQGEPLRAGIAVNDYYIWQPAGDYRLPIDLFGQLDTHSPHEIVRIQYADLKAIARIKSKSGFRFYFESNNLAVFDGSNTAIQDAVFYADSVGELNFSIDADHWRDFVNSLPEYPMAHLMELEIHVRNGVPTRLVWRGNNEARVVLLG